MCRIKKKKGLAASFERFNLSSERRAVNDQGWWCMGQVFGAAGSSSSRRVLLRGGKAAAE